MKVHFEVTAPRLYDKNGNLKPSEQLELETDKLVGKINNLWNSGKVHRISVTDHHGGNPSVSPAEVIKRAKKQNPDIDLEAHLTTNHTTKEIADTLGTLEEAGAQRLLVISGDKLKPYGFKRELRSAVDLAGYVQQHFPYFVVDVATDHNPRRINRLDRKMEAGNVQGVLTQPFTYVDVHNGTLDSVRENLDARGLDAHTAYAAIFIGTPGAFDYMQRLPGMKLPGEIRARLVEAEKEGKRALRQEASHIFRESYRALKKAGVPAINVMGVPGIISYNKLVEPLQEHRKTA